MNITTLEILPLREALEDADCGECGNRLAWGFNNSQENPEWTARCCNITYKIIVQNVEVFKIGSDEGELV